MFGRCATVFVDSWWNRFLQFGARNVTGDCGGFFPRMDTGLLAPQSLMCEPRLPFNLCDASFGPHAMYMSTNISFSQALECPLLVPHLVSNRRFGAQQDERKRCDGAIGCILVRGNAVARPSTVGWASCGQTAVSCVMRRRAFWVCRLPKSQQWQGCTTQTAGVRRHR